MFGDLVESGRRWERGTRGVVVSVAIHAALVLAAGAATAGTRELAPREVTHHILRWVPASPPEAPTRAPRGRSRGEGAPTIPAPPLVRVSLDVGRRLSVDLPAEPPLDRLLAIGDEIRRVGRSGAAGRGSSPAGDPDAGRFVDRPAVPARDNPEPVYPSILRAAGIEGRVRARFVVDSTGRVDPASIVLEATGSDLFGTAVRRALVQARFTPAEVHGRLVRMAMVQEFLFRLRR